MEEMEEIPRKKLLLFAGKDDLTFQEIKVWKSFLGSMVEANKVYFDQLSESAALIQKIGGEPREIKGKLGQNSIYAAEKIQEALNKIGTFHKDVFGDVAKYRDPEGDFKDLLKHTDVRFDVLRKNAACHLRQHEKLEKESQKAWKYYMRRMRKQASLEKQLEEKEKHDSKLHYKSLKFASKTSTALTAYQACYQQEVKHRKHLEKQSECLRREFLREEKSKLNTMFKFINSTLGKLEKLAPQGLPGIDEADFEMRPVNTKQMARSSWDTYVKEKTFTQQMDKDPTLTVVRRFKESDDEADHDSDDEEEEDILAEKVVHETPIESIASPIQSFGTTGECFTSVGSPKSPVKGYNTPVKGSQSPVKSFKTTVECNETPIECLETSIECLETTTVECVETPVQHSETSAKSLATPACNSKTPIQNFKRPMQSMKPKVNNGSGTSNGSPTSEGWLQKRTASSLMDDDLDTVLQDILDDEILFEDPPRKSESVSKPLNIASSQTILNAMTVSETPSLHREQELSSSIIDVGPVVDGRRSFTGQFEAPRNKHHKFKCQEDNVPSERTITDGMRGAPKRQYKVTKILPSDEIGGDVPTEGNTVQQTGPAPTLDSSNRCRGEQGVQTGEIASYSDDNNKKRNREYFINGSTEMLELKGEHAENSLPDKESAEVQMRQTSNARRRRREAKTDTEESSNKRIPLPIPFLQQSSSVYASTLAGISPRHSDQVTQLELGPKTGKVYVFPVCDWKRQSQDQLNLKRGAKLTQINSENKDGFCYGYKKSKFGSKKFGFFPAALVSHAPQP